MTTTQLAQPAKLKLRKRFELAGYLAVFLFMFFTVASAGMTVIPMHMPSEREILQAELDEIVQLRKERIAVLAGVLGDKCQRIEAAEYAKLLVMDGRWADASRYANQYETKCGEDANVRKWGNAPVPRVASIMRSLNRN